VRPGDGHKRLFMSRKVLKLLDLLSPEMHGAVIEAILGQGDPRGKRDIQNGWSSEMRLMKPWSVCASAPAPTPLITISG
jgi:hypothetical protein